jgi:hypothetical protein
MRVLAGAALGLALLALVVGAVRTHDLSAANRLAAACMRIRDGRAAMATQLRPMMDLLFVDDAPFIGQVVGELGEEPCVEVEGRLRETFSIGALRTFEATPWPPERLAHLRRAVDGARERCPAVMGEVFRSLAGTDTEASAMGRESCDRMINDLDAFASRDTETTAPLGLHEWVAQMERLAAELPASPGPEEP